MTARQLYRLSAIATLWGNGYQGCLKAPKAWANKRVYCMLRDEYNQVRDMCERNNIEEVMVG